MLENTRLDNIQKKGLERVMNHFKNEIKAFKAGGGSMEECLTFMNTRIPHNAPNEVIEQIKEETSYADSVVEVMRPYYNTFIKEIVKRVKLEIEKIYNT